jgi:hypothetical protein
MVPGVLLAAGALFSPESPRWLAKQGQWESAEARLIDLRQLPSTSDYIVTEMLEIREQLERENAIRGTNVTAMQRFRELFLKGNWNRLLIGVTLMMCQNMTGVNVSFIFIFSAPSNETQSISSDYHLLQPPHLRDPWNHWHQHQAVRYWFLWYCKDGWYDHLLSLAC